MKLYNLFFLPLASAIIRGYNFYGLETPRKDFVCTWANPVKYYIDKLYDLKFNAIRLPFSLQYIHDNNWQKMDEFFDAIKGKDMFITMDMHRVFASHQGESPLEAGTSLTEFVDGWITILDRYKDNPQVVAVDIFNEFQGTDAVYWNSIAKQIVTKIEERFPNRFTYYVGGTRWGGNLAGISLEDLPFNDRINYTIHKYVFSGNSIPSDWQYSFGEHKDKVNVGEWGFKTDVPQQVSWAWSFINWLKQNNIRDSYFWTIAHSGDTGGIWYDDCYNIDWNKYNIIKALWEDNRFLRTNNITIS